MRDRRLAQVIDASLRLQLEERCAGVDGGSKGLAGRITN